MYYATSLIVLLGLAVGIRAATTPCSIEAGPAAAPNKVVAGSSVWSWQLADRALRTKDQLKATGRSAACMNSGVRGATACGSDRTPLSAWKEGAGAWSSAAGRQLAEGIGDRTDTCGNMRKFVAMQEMDGAILARLHHKQWC